jgi:hypothetical protein
MLTGLSSSFENQVRYVDMQGTEPASERLKSARENRARHPSRHDKEEVTD